MMLPRFLESINLDLAGILALVPLDLIAERTAIEGTSSLRNTFVLCPGVHRELAAVDLHKGEYPAVADLTTGYVFRVENQATVYYLQRIAITGHLTRVEVKRNGSEETGDSILCSVLYDMIASLTGLTFSFMGFCKDWWGMGTILLLMSSRLLNSISVRRRSKPGWKGASEPGVQGDLLVLLGQGKWIRLCGLVDDLKMVISGQWLRDPIFAESLLESLGKLHGYITLEQCPTGKQGLADTASANICSPSCMQQYSDTIFSYAWMPIATKRRCNKVCETARSCRRADQ